MKKLFIIVIILTAGIVSSCGIPKNQRDAYCSALKNSKLVNIEDLQKGDTQTLRVLLKEYKTIKDVAPPNLVSSWEILISNTDLAIKESNSQTLYTDTDKQNPYIVAYKKILNDYNRDCI